MLESFVFELSLSAGFGFVLRADRELEFRNIKSLSQSHTTEVDAEPG